MPSFPELPIIQPPPPPAPERKTQAEKYGGLFFLGIGGLLALVLLVGWFAYGLWSLRDVWANVYAVNDPKRPDRERIEAARVLSKDPRVSQRQLWDLALSRVPPPAARYLLAEALTGEAAEDDPRGYVLAVSRSEGWPGWLRILLARPVAYAAGEGKRFPEGSLVELSRNTDPVVSLWGVYALAVSSSNPGPWLTSLRRSAESAGPLRDFARLLLEAAESRQPDRDEALDRATLWLRGYAEAKVLLNRSNL